MKILFIGKKNCSDSAKARDYLKELGHTITEVWSAKRGEKLPKDIINWRGDYLFSLYSYYIVPEKLLSNVRVAVNFHPASPAHPGSGMVNWALYEGDDTFGATAHLMDAKIDNGAILKVKRFPITETDDIESIIDKTRYHCTDLFFELVKELLVDEVSIENLIASSSHEKWLGVPRKINEVDSMSLIDIKIESEELANRVKAFHTKNFPLTLYLHGHKFIHV